MNKASQKDNTVGILCAIGCEILILSTNIDNIKMTI